VKVAILHQGFVPRYRVRFFEKLSSSGSHEYVVFHGPPPSGVGHRAADPPYAFPNVEVATHEVRLMGKSLIYQPVLGRVIRRFDAAVLGTHVQFLANHAVFAAFKALRRPVIYWGKGEEKATGRNGVARQLSRLAVSTKERARHLADGYLAYSPGGADHLRRAGIPDNRIGVVPNTLDVEDQVALHARFQRADESALRRELGLRETSRVLVYLGRIYPEKRVEEVLEAMSLLRASEAELVIIGDGPAAAALRRERADRAGVHFAGELRDQAEVARYLRVACAVVIPGAVGLAVNHAFAHGVPVVTRASSRHGPEIEYLSDGVNGLIVEGSLDRFTAALSELVDNEELQANLAGGALETRSALSLDRMVEAFDMGVSGFANGQP
jgi:glycosyltransferase involved in cell wall biosynthesis